VGLIVLTLLLLASAAAQAQPARVLALLSHDAPPYRAALEGFRAQVARGAAPTIQEVVLDGDEAAARAALQTFVDGGGALVLALGTVAVEAARTRQEVSVVGGLVLSDSQLRGGNVTGVTLGVPPDVQFQWVKRLLPKARRLGVLYNPEENRAVVAGAGEAAAREGVELVSREVSGPQAIPAGLASLEQSADALWGLPDRVVFVPQAAKAILLFSFRNRIPLVGPSEAWVKAGALFALDPDYRDLGAQCGELASAILAGAKAASLPPTLPRTAVLSVNKKTATQMKVDLSPEILRLARTVVE
jgi:putative ABC transport system substrate-binding protein